MCTLKRQNLDMNYFKILGASQLIIRLALYNVVNNTNDLWLHYSYSFVDLLLVFPILKDYDRLTKKTTIFCLGVNLLSFLLYLNIDFINIIPFYLCGFFNSCRCLLIGFKNLVFYLSGQQHLGVLQFHPAKILTISKMQITFPSTGIRTYNATLSS